MPRPAANIFRRAAAGAKAGKENRRESFRKLTGESGGCPIWWRQATASENAATKKQGALADALF
jgi:hypothetical protein